MAQGIDYQEAWEILSNELYKIVRFERINDTWFVMVDLPQKPRDV